MIGTSSFTGYFLASVPASLKKNIDGLNAVEQAAQILIMMRIVIALFALVLLTPPTLLAQRGDKPGEAQHARIPKENIPPSPPLSPSDALKQFKVQPGYKIELAASEPTIEVPTILQFDPDGRLWVVEMRGFMATPDGVGETNPVGRISILEDTNGDGTMDRHKVFLDGLVMPRALLLVNDGALVCEPPNLWFYPIKDDQPGARVLVASDFAKDADPTLGLRMNPEHSGNSLTLALDNWIYSLYHPFRYRFAEGKWKREPVPQRAQWGQAQDDFGRLYYTSNSDQLRGDMLPPHYFGSKVKQKLPGIGIQVAKDQATWPARINPGVNRGYQSGTLRDDGTLARFTAACGTCIYRGTLLPPDAYGNAFVCEPSANLIRRNILSEQDGIVSARNACDKSEFIASTDELFRPVNMTTGPDGALYIADMYHGIIQHRFFLTSYLRRQAEDRGIEKVTDHGRIWRVLAEGKKAELVVKYSTLASADLVKQLENPNGARRDTAQRLLVERQDASVVDALKSLAANPANPVFRLHALWTLEGLGRLDEPTLGLALKDSDSKVRAAAIRLTAQSIPSNSLTSVNAAVAVTDRLAACATDASADVQAALALALSSLPPTDRSKATVAELAKSSASLVRDTARYAQTVFEPVKPEVAVSRARPLTPDEMRRFDAGKAMYEATCLACHQAHGMGQIGLAPPLVGSEWVAGPESRIIRIVLNGLRGPIKVKGETFELDMPTLGVLDDEQIAAALTYVRREWGHGYEPVTPEAVKKVREATASREDAWTMLELLKVP